MKCVHCGASSNMPQPTKLQLIAELEAERNGTRMVEKKHLTSKERDARQLLREREMHRFLRQQAAEHRKPDGKKDD